VRQRPRIRYEPKPLQGQEVLRIFLLVIAVATTFVLHVWMRTLVISEGFRLGESRNRVLALEAEKVKLRLEREKLISPDRLNEIVQRFRAESDYFVSPSPQQILFYQEGSRPKVQVGSGVPAR
jgi:hypothetical protein